MLFAGLGLGFPTQEASSASEEAKDRTFGGLAQSVECVVCNDEAPGSKPGFSILFVVYSSVLVSLVGQDSRLSPDRPGFKSR